MKKLDVSLFRDYPPVVIKVEHIEELDRALRANSETVTIQCDDYSFESVAELEKHFKGNRVRKIEMISSKPFFTIINLNPTGALIHVGSSNTIASGLFFQLDQVLSRYGI